jgi:fimbrial isopeptide formation D2 family protein
MRGIARRSWATRGIGAAGIAGLALVAAVLLLWSSAPGQGVPGVHAAEATDTPTPTATPNPDCNLKASKSDSPDPVARDGQITYTITVENKGDSANGSCDGLTVTDKIPDDTDCTDATVDSSSDISDSHFTIKGCEQSGEVTWKTSSKLDTGKQVVLTMVVDLQPSASGGETITNLACADSDTASRNNCATEKTKVSAEGGTVTPAPTTAPMPIATAPPVAPPPAVPTAVRVPNTGSGPGSSSNSALALALGLTGGALLLLGGTGVWLRRRS